MKITIEINSLDEIISAVFKLNHLLVRKQEACATEEPEPEPEVEEPEVEEPEVEEPEPEVEEPEPEVEEPEIEEPKVKPARKPRTKKPKSLPTISQESALAEMQSFGKEFGLPAARELIHKYAPMFAQIPPEKLPDLMRDVEQYRAARA